MFLFNILMAMTLNPNTGGLSPAVQKGWRCVLLSVLFLLALMEGSAAPQEPKTNHANHQVVSGEGNGFFQNFLKVYTPRKQCMDNEPTLVGLHVVADMLI